jgi:hypothetical protein
MEQPTILSNSFKKMDPVAGSFTKTAWIYNVTIYTTDPK